MNEKLVDLCSELCDPARRTSAAERIAETFDGVALRLFVRDDDLDVLVPAPGFPSTVPAGPTWWKLLSACSRAGGVASGEVAFPDSTQIRPATAISDDRGLTAVLIGPVPNRIALRDLRRMVRLIAPMFRSEQKAAAADGAAAVARKEATQAHSLSLALEAARIDLEKALNESARLNRELQQADRLKDEFLATLAHELRNPLAALSIAIYLTRTKLAPDHPAGAANAVAVRQADRLARLIDDLMDVSRITNGKVKLRIEALDVDVILARAVESVRAHVEARGHALTVRSEGGPLWIAADAVRMEQIVTNLLTNAVKYTNDGGRIDLLANKVVNGSREHLRLVVRDNGIGIAAAMLPKVFDLFAQANAQASPPENSPENQQGTLQDGSQGGLGIGLTLVRKLVEMQGGTIVLTSEGLGRGTEGSVTFPLIERPAGVVVRERTGGLSGSAGRRCKVLIVDDNSDLAESVAEFVMQWGHEARVVRDGATALTESEIFKPDVVLLDIGLPDMTGYEVASRIKQRQFQNTPLLIALTGYDQSADRQRTTEAGFDRHLPKPLEMDHLERILAEAGNAASAKPGGSGPDGF